MMDLLLMELETCGVHLATIKTKLFTASLVECARYVNVCSDLAPILWGDDSHKYLGHARSGNLERRRAIKTPQASPGVHEKKMLPSSCDRNCLAQWSVLRSFSVCLLCFGRKKI